MEQESIAGKHTPRIETCSPNVLGDATSVPLSTPSADRTKARKLSYSSTLSEASTAAPASTRAATYEQELVTTPEDRLPNIQATMGSRPVTASGSATSNSQNAAIGINLSRLSTIQPPAVHRTPKRRVSESHVSSSTSMQRIYNGLDWLVKTTGEEATDGGDCGSSSGAAEPKTVQGGVAAVEESDDAKPAAAKDEEKQQQVSTSSPVPCKVEGTESESKTARFKEKLLRDGPLPGFLKLKRRGSSSLLEDKILEDKMPNPFEQEFSCEVIPKSPREALSSDCGAKFGLGDFPSPAARKVQLLKQDIISPRSPQGRRRHSTSQIEQGKSVTLLDDKGVLTTPQMKSPEPVKPSKPSTGRPAFQRRHTAALSLCSTDTGDDQQAVDSPMSPGKYSNRDSDQEATLSPRTPLGDSPSQKHSFRSKRLLRRHSTHCLEKAGSEAAQHYCSKGHPMSLMFVGKHASGSASHSCSKCKRQGIVSPESVYRCGLCDYDLCESCAGVSCTSSELFDQKLKNLSVAAGVASPSGSHAGIPRSIRKERPTSNAEADLGLMRRDSKTATNSPRPASNAEADLGLMRRDSKTASYPQRRNSKTVRRSKTEHGLKMEHGLETEHGLEQASGICSLAQTWGKAQGG